MKFVLTQPLDEAAMKVLKEDGADVYIANSPDTFIKAGIE